MRGSAPPPVPAPGPPAIGVRGVVVGHGDMARGLVTAVTRIAGAQDGVLAAVSNEGRGPDELRATILAEVGEGPGVVFTDLGAGSCTLAARLLCRERSRVAVVTGVNLPMLLEFVFHRDMELAPLLERLQARARDGIRVVAGG
ncbi:MAG: hypothetical protein RQ751_02780 [Longimicrobiales bacterium]|nr:hypothetical protein [Longimicrobiales bacterium]